MSKLKRVVGLLYVFCALIVGCCLGGVLATRNFPSTLQAETYTDDYGGQWTYTVNNSNIVITNYSGSSARVTVPNAIAGKTVTNIGNNTYSVFNENSAIETLIIPDSVQSIGYRAVYNCSALSSVTIGTSVTFISYRAFYACTNITEINYNAINCADISTNQAAFYNGSDSNANITVNIGANVERIPARLFGSNNSENATYDQCYNIGTINFVDNTKLTSIGEYAFNNYNNSTRIRKRINITNLAAWCGVTFDSVYASPLGSNIINSPNELYVNNDKVINLNIPNTVIRIKPYTFYNLKQLVSVTIPASVNVIGNSAFYGCSNLERVNFYHDYSGGMQSSNDDRSDYIGQSAFSNGKNEVRYYFINEASKNSAMNLQSTCFTSSGAFLIMETPPAVKYSVMALAFPVKAGSVAGSGEYSPNASVTLTATAYEGYTFRYWLLEGQEFANNTQNPLSITVTQNAAYSAMFQDNSNPSVVIITTQVSPSAGGIITGGDEYEPNDSVTLTAIANEGYTFKYWLKGGARFNGDTTNPLTFTATQSTLYTAVFERNSSQNTARIVLAISPNGGGTATGSGDYELNKTVTLTATPNNGYIFLYWRRDGNSFEGNIENPLTFTAMQNALYTAVFEENITNTVTIDATASPTAGGSVTGGDVYATNSMVTLTAVANRGYAFSRWLKVNSTYFNSTQNPLTFKATQNLTYVAVFVQNSQSGEGEGWGEQKVSITTTQFPSAGGRIDGGGDYDVDEAVTLTAIADREYRFSYWLKDNVVFSGNTNNPITVIATQNVIYTAVFEKKNQTNPDDNGGENQDPETEELIFVKGIEIIVKAYSNSEGTVTGGGVYAKNTRVTLIADAFDGYVFDYWLKDDEVYKKNSVIEIYVQEETTYTAVFKPANATQKNGVLIMGIIAGGGVVVGVITFVTVRLRRKKKAEEFLAKKHNNFDRFY